MSVPNIKAIGGLSDDELKQLHSKIHAIWQSIPTEDVWNYHKLLVEEMTKRGISHKSVDNLDNELVPLGEYPQDEDIANLSADLSKNWHILVHNYYNTNAVDRTLLSKTHELLVNQLHTHGIAHCTPLEEEKTDQQQLAVVFNETSARFYVEEQELLENKVRLSRLMIERMSKK